MPVDLVTMAPTRVVDSSEYLGLLRSRTAATLQPQVEGQITAILVKPGDMVEAGQALMRIDPGRQPAAVAQASAAHAAREATLRLAKLNLERERRLLESGATTAQDLDNARAAEEAARGDVAATGAEIAANRVQLAFYNIVAPSHGVVGDIPGRVGDRVTTQTALTTVTDNGVLENNISIPVERAYELHVGTEVELVDDASRVIGGGKIGFISAQVNPDTQSVLVKADIPNGSGALRSAQVVRSRVVWRAHDGLTVPAVAITRLGGQAFVFVAAPADHGLVAKQRPVQLGDLTNNMYVVTSGLAAGDRVVTSAIQKLHDGTPVAEAPPPPHEARPAPPPARPHT